MLMKTKKNYSNFILFFRGFYDKLNKMRKGEKHDIRRKEPVENPKFVLVAGQTGSGKSNLTASLYLIYSSNSNEKRFSCALEALMYAQQRDAKIIMDNFENRYKTVKSQMDNRNAPREQKEQLGKVWERYEKTREQEMDY